MTINPNITIMMQYAYFGSAVQERERENITAGRNV
jgi:hypothetical protein